MQIKDSVAVVTGGANGIGEAVSRYLAKNGAKVVVVDMSQKDIDRVVGGLKTAGASAIGINANVTSEADTARFYKAAIDAFGQVNIVVACAGIIRDGTMLNIDKATGKVSRKMTLDKWQAVIDVNLTGTFLTVRDGAEAMVNGGW
ncbi:MAG: SDR family NAD(P)-dependent oxidoreductase, partial [Elusimicrobia bacterium]|nr:SDR family NAD(P)-dependent oxidoreductase [Elusimicrobiota bacterium]